MKRVLVGLVIALIGLIGGSTPTVVGATIQVVPGVFDPGHTGTVASLWVKHLGEPDPNDPGDTDRFGLLLSKNTVTTTNASAGANVTNVSGIHLTELGFDIRNGGNCGAGAPRFNVVTNDNVLHFVGCAAGTKTAATPEPGWTRVRMDPTNPAQAFPPVSPTQTVKSMQIIFDEGTDTSPTFSGDAIIDNVDVNTFLVGAPSGTL